MSPPKNIRSLDMRLIDELFQMEGGYVLDFSNRTFAEFFAEELRVDIYSDQYAVEGGSKAKRLRSFLRQADPKVRVRTLEALWEYREAGRRRSSTEEWAPDAEAEFEALVGRLEGRKPKPKPRDSTKVTVQDDPPVDAATLAALKADLIRVGQVAPVRRGFEWERWLKKLFDAYGLSPRASFRLVGEQVDGSFALDSGTYLLEAKWTATQVGVNELRAFNGKVEAKAAWSRGLLVSESGFSKGGLTAFGTGKSVVCMDGLDLYEILDRGLHFPEVVARKVRHASETGEVFVRVRDLYP